MLTSRHVPDGYSFRLDADSSSTYSDSSSSIYKQRIDSLFRPATSAAAAVAASSSHSDYEPVEAPPERKPPPPPPPPPSRPLPAPPATAALWAAPGGTAGAPAAAAAASSAPLWSAPAREPPGPGAGAPAAAVSAATGRPGHGAEFTVEYLGAVQVQDGAARLEELQQPLKRLYLPRLHRRRATPLADFLQITETGVRIGFGRAQEIFNPFSTVAVWAAVKFVASRGGAGGGGRLRFGFLPLICDPESPERGRLQEDLDGSLPADAPAARHPPLLACVMRRPGTLGALECHGFVCASAEDAIVIAANLYQALLLRMQPDGGSGGSSGDRRLPAAARAAEAPVLVSGSGGSGSEDALGRPRRPRRRRAPPPPPPGPPCRDDTARRSDRRPARPVSADLTGLDRHRSPARSREHSRDLHRDHSRDSVRRQDLSRDHSRDSVRRRDFQRSSSRDSVRRRDFQRSSSRDSVQRREFQRGGGREEEANPDRSRESGRRRPFHRNTSRESGRHRPFHRSASRESGRSRTFSREQSGESVRGRLGDAPSDGSLRRRAGSVGAVPGLVAAAAAAAARQHRDPATDGAAGARSGRRVSRSSSDPSRGALVLASSASDRPRPAGAAAGPGPLAPDPAVDLGQLLAQLQQRDGIRTVDDVLRRVIAPGGMSFSELRPEHRELLLRLALTLSRDEMYQRSKSIMKKQTRKGTFFTSESDNSTSDGSSTISNVLKATKKSLSRLGWRAGGFQSPSAYLKQHTPLGKLYNARAKQKDAAKSLADEFPAKISSSASADSEGAASRPDSDSSWRRGNRRAQAPAGRRRSPERCGCELDALPDRFGSLRDRGAHLPPSRSLLELPLTCDADSCSGSDRCYCSLQRADSAAGGDSDRAGRRHSAADLLSERTGLQQVGSAEDSGSGSGSSGGGGDRRCRRRHGSSRGAALRRADSADTRIDPAADEDAGGGGGGGGRFLVVSAADEAGRVLRRGGSQRRRDEDVLTLKKSTEIAATFSGLRLSQTTDLLSSGSDGEPAGRRPRHGYSDHNIEDSLGYLP